MSDLPPAAPRICGQVSEGGRPQPEAWAAPVTQPGTQGVPWGRSRLTQGPWILAIKIHGMPLAAPALPVLK